MLSTPDLKPCETCKDWSHGTTTAHNVRPGMNICPSGPWVHWSMVAGTASSLPRATECKPCSSTSSCDSSWNVVVSPRHSVYHHHTEIHCEYVTVSDALLHTYFSTTSCLYQQLKCHRLSQTFCVSSSHRNTLCVCVTVADAILHTSVSTTTCQ